MNKIRYALLSFIFLTLLLFGVFMIVFGEYDDSPGAQLIGLILVIISSMRIFLITKKFIATNKKADK